MSDVGENPPAQEESQAIDPPAPDAEAEDAPQDENPDDAGEQPPADEEEAQAQDAENPDAQEEAPAGPGDAEPQEEASMYHDDEAVRAHQKMVRDNKLTASKEKRYSEQAAFQERVASKQQATTDGKTIIDLTKCFDCKSHAWCTAHNESKYDNMAAAFEAAVIANLGENYYVAINCLQPSYKIGAFEIQIGDKVYFSKLTSQCWPSAKGVCDKISGTTADEKYEAAPKEEAEKFETEAE
jgi:hypothetical protein